MGAGGSPASGRCARSRLGHRVRRTPSRGRPQDEVRSAARMLIWAPDLIDARAIATCDEAVARASAPARWEWWGARAHAALTTLRTASGADVLSALVALVDVPAPLGSRGPALDAGA